MADPDKFNIWLNPTQEAPSTSLPQLPDSVRGLEQVITGVVDLLLGVLDFALTALDIVKSFTVGFIDPINALIEALISEVEGILLGFRDVGLYLAGDWYLVRPPYVDLLGGFSAFENRMVARFLDKTDPTRPDINSQTEILGVFLYASADFSTVSRLVRFLTQIVTFFNFDVRTTKTQLTPVNLEVQYGLDEADFLFVQNTVEALTEGASPPNLASISWGLSAPTARAPYLPFPPPPPHGFLVEISTVREGLPVFFDKPVPNSPQVEGEQKSLVQDRVQGRVLDPEGREMILFGGGDQVEVDPSIQYNRAMEGFKKVKPGAARVYTQLTSSDNEPLPLELLKLDDGTHLFQRSFFVPTAQIFGTGEDATLSPDFFQKARYNFTVDYADLPSTASFFADSDTGEISIDTSTLRQPLSYFARVAVVSDAVNTDDGFKLVVDGATVDAPGAPFKAAYGDFRKAGGESGQLGRVDKGPSSLPVELNFPSVQSANYVDMLTVALAILVMSRADVEVSDKDEFQDNQAKVPTGLEAFAPLVPQILRVSNSNDFYELADQDTEDSDVIAFRDTILQGCRSVASELYRTIGVNPSLEAQILARASILLTLQLGDPVFVFGQTDEGGFSTAEADPIPYGLTILEALEDADVGVGLARSPEAAGLGVTRGFMTRDLGLLVERPDPEPRFYSKSEVQGAVIGSVDNSPVLVQDFEDDVKRMFFVRNLFPDEVYQAAALVLNVSAPVNLKPVADGAWISYRMAQLIPPLDQFLDVILEWANAIGAGSQSITDAILDYIDFMESRILELQALISRIDSLVASIIPVSFPPFASLFVLASGTDEVLTKFLAADEKPLSGPGSFGGGAVLMVAGGPSFIVDAIAEIFFSEED
jgi:hypothetical protein